jgi:hypothetical protein
MTSQLTIDDYKYILNYYKKTIPKSDRLIKIQAEKIIANKLCRCIKKFDKKNEARSISICTKTVINNKGYKRGKITCKNKQKVELSKKNKTVKNTKK